MALHKQFDLLHQDNSVGINQAACVRLFKSFMSEAAAIARRASVKSYMIVCKLFQLKADKLLPFFACKAGATL